jgi:hypothetical protein
VWWGKRAISELTLVLEDGSTLIVPAGDWAIYPDPQLVEGEMPTTTVVETDENIQALYT